MFEPSTTTWRGPFFGCHFNSLVPDVEQAPQRCPRRIRPRRALATSRRHLEGSAATHRRLAGHDPSGTLGLRRRDPHQPVRSVRTLRAQHGLPNDFIRSVNATNPHDNAWARSGAQRDRAGRVRHPVRGRIRGARPSRRRRRRARVAVGRGPPGDGDGAGSGQGGGPAHGLPHQQRGRRRPVAPTSPTSWRASIRSSSRARSACASPSRASTRSPANCSPSNPASASSSTTSASTSSPPRPWA